MACVSRPSCLKPRHSDGKCGLRLLAKPRFTHFSIEPRLASARDGICPIKCGPTTWGVRDKLGSSAAQMSGAAVSRTGGSRIYTGPVLQGLQYTALQELRSSNCYFYSSLLTSKIINHHVCYITIYTVDIQQDCISDGTKLTDSHLEHQYLRFI